MKMPALSRTLAVAGAALLLIAPVAPATAAPVDAAPIDAAPVGAAPGSGPTVYHVDCDVDEPGIGTLERPLTSLDAVRVLELEPGDAVLFQRGSTCDGALTTRGSGAAGAPITIDAYGDPSAPLPVIAGGGVPAAVLLDDQEHWEIRNLEITNADADEGDRFRSVRRGLVVKNTDQGELSHFRLENLYIHDVTGQNKKDLNGSGGIQLEVHPGTVPSWFDGIVIANNRIEDVNRSGINMSSAWMCRQEMAWDASFCGTATRAANPWVPSTGLVIRDNVVDGTGGDGIVVQMNRGALVEGNVVMDAANRANQGSNAGLWAWNADDTVFRGNTVAGTKRLAGNNDGTSFDIDYGTRNTVFEYNVSYGNEGGMVFYCGCSASWLPGAGFASEGVYRYNVSIGEQNRSGFLSGATDGAFYNNTVLVTDPSQTEFLSVNDSGSSVLFANNLVISTVAGIATAPEGAPNIMTWRNNAFYSPGGAGSWPGEAADANSYRSLDALPPAVRAEVDRLAAVDYAAVTGELDLTTLAFEIPELAGAGIPVAQAGVTDLFGAVVPSCGVDIGAAQFSGPGACDLPASLVDADDVEVTVPAASTVRVSGVVSGGAELSVRNEAGLVQTARPLDGGDEVFAVVRTTAGENTLELECTGGACAEIVIATVDDAVVDGSFESLYTAYRDPRTSPWSRWNSDRSTQGAASGDHSLRLTPGASGASSELVGVPVRPGTTYDLAGWVNAATAGPSGLALGVKWGEGTVESGTAVNAHATTTGSLEHVTARVQVPEGIGTATVYCYQPAAAGVATCDDVTLTAVDPAAPVIDRQPVSSQVPIGATGHLSLAVSGDHPATVAWQQSVAGGAWQGVTGDRFGTTVPASSTALAVPPRDDVRYRAIVTDAVTGSTVVSDEATVASRADFTSDPGALEALEVVTGPAKNVYLVGEPLDTAGLVVDAHFGNGTYRIADVGALSIDESAFSPWRVGTYEVPVSFADGAVTRSATFSVDVRDRVTTTVGCADAGATLSASFSQTEWGSFPAGLACDGDAATSWSSWSSTRDRPADTLTADFAETTRLAGVEVDWFESVPAAATVQYRDAGGEWRDAAPAVTGIVLTGQRATTAVAFDSAVETDGMRVVADYAPAAGGYVKVAELRFTVEAQRAPSSDAALEALLIDGTAVDGFEAGRLAYAAVWGDGIPVVTARSAHPGATIEITAATLADPLAEIVVTAADTTTTRTYTVAFDTSQVVEPGDPGDPGTPTEPGVPGGSDGSSRDAAGAGAGVDGLSATGGQPSGLWIVALLLAAIGVATLGAVRLRRGIRPSRATRSRSA